MTFGHFITSSFHPLTWMLFIVLSVHVLATFLCKSLPPLLVFSS